MEEFIKNFKDSENISIQLNSEDILQNTPLLIAAEKGHANIVKQLLKNQADIKKLNRKGKNALKIAMDEGHKNVIATILDSEVWKDSLR